MAPGQRGQDQHNISFLKTLIGIRPPAKHSQNWGDWSPVDIDMWSLDCGVAGVSFNINNTQYAIYYMYNTLGDCALVSININNVS